MKHIFKIFLLIFTLLQAAQAGRYYHSDYGRFISRDPIGYQDGMSLYNAYFAERFALDPSGLVFKEIVNNVPLTAIQQIHRRYWGWTSTQVPPQIHGKDEIKTWKSDSGCWCAKIEKAKQIDLFAVTFNPTTTIDVRGYEVLTQNFIIDYIVPHEKRRRDAMKKGYEEYYKNIQLTGKWVSYCGVKCGPDKDKLIAKLQKYLDDMREKATKEYLEYELKEQRGIGKEGKANIEYDDQLRAVKLNYIHQIQDPPKFKPPECPK